MSNVHLHYREDLQATSEVAGRVLGVGQLVSLVRQPEVVGLLVEEESNYMVRVLWPVEPFEHAGQQPLRVRACLDALKAIYCDASTIEKLKYNMRG